MKVKWVYYSYQIKGEKTMELQVYLNFDGNCRQALEFYSKVFKTEISYIMTFGEQPPDPEWEIPEEVKDKIMHARLNLADTTVMFSDVFPGMPFTLGNNVTLTIVDKDKDEIKRLYKELAEGGTIQMELQETFWSEAYAGFTDKFGVEWQLSHDNGTVY